MNRILVTLLLVSGAANAFLLYRVVDVGVTTTYQSAEIKSLKQQQDQMQKLLPLLQKGISRDAVVGAARDAGLEVMNKEPNTLYVGMIEFIFKDGVVSDIRLE
jgi:hypothetical protein